MSETQLLYIYNHSEVRHLARQRFPDCWEDIMQDLAIILQTVTLTLSDDEAKRYACRTLLNISNATRGQVARRYKQHNPLPEQVEIPDESQEQLPTIEQCTKRLNWYHEGVFKLYVKYGTVSKVSEVTGIPKRSISEAVKRAQKLIKQAW